MNSSNVFSSTNNNVKDLTNIAPIPNPIEIIIISLLNANAPKTPSKENDASISSRYKNEIKPVHINLPILEHSCCLFSDSSSNLTDIVSIAKNVKMPAKPDNKTS